MSMERITINHIASGQPRPYADSRTISQVKIEHTPSMWSPYNRQTVKMEDAPFEPWYLNAKGAELILRRFGLLGTVPWKKDAKHGLDSHIVYIKPINPKKASEVRNIPMTDQNEEVSDIWEFYICQPFCD